MDGVVADVSITSEKGQPCTIVNPWPGRKVQLMRNGVKDRVVEGDRFSFGTAAGEVIRLNPL